MIVLPTMEVCWNTWKLLDKPAYVTWQISPHDAKKKGVNVTAFKIALGTAIRSLEPAGDLRANATILSRLIYRMKTKLRNDKGMMYMRRLNKALTNYYNLHLEKEYITLRSHLQMEDGVYILPSKQWLDYTLAKTLGFAKLLTRIDEISKYAAFFLLSRIKLGAAWSMTLVAYATICKIWSLAKMMIQKCCTWYDLLYHCGLQFEYVGGKPWHPENHVIPPKLKPWLCSEWEDTDMIFDHHEEAWKQVFPEKESPTEIYDDVVTKFAADEKIHGTDDVGEVVDREDFESTFSPNDRSISHKREQSEDLKNPKKRRKK